MGSAKDIDTAKAEVQGGRGRSQDHAGATRGGLPGDIPPGQGLTCQA